MNNTANNNCAESIGTAKLPTRSIDSARELLPSAFSRLPGCAPVATVRHLYVHIPFCARICPYCAFYKDLLDRSQTARFCEAILQELEYCSAQFDLVPHTIFFGGGTPTALTINQLELVLSGFHRQLDLSQLREWTVEANPGSISRRKAALLLQMGVTRISLGVQSWDDTLLKLLGRDHKAGHAAESFWILRQAGFKNINIDLMFGLPQQTPDQWRATLEKTIQLRPEHISAYCLTYEEDTEFFLRRARGDFRSNSDIEADLFQLAMSMLADAGYNQYEISNYALPGYASRHNRAYWAGENYLGLGPSAFSTVAMRRWQNVCDYREYADRVLAHLSATGSTEELTADMKRTERIALSLRSSEGLAADMLAAESVKTNEFVKLGLLRRASDSFVLTNAGKCVADSVAEAFI